VVTSQPLRLNCEKCLFGRLSLRLQKVPCANVKSGQGNDYQLFSFLFTRKSQHDLDLPSESATVVRWTFSNRSKRKECGLHLHGAVLAHPMYVTKSKAHQNLIFARKLRQGLFKHSYRNFQQLDCQIITCSDAEQLTLLCLQALLMFYQPSHFQNVTTCNGI